MPSNARNGIVTAVESELKRWPGRQVAIGAIRMKTAHLHIIITTQNEALTYEGDQSHSSGELKNSRNIGGDRGRSGEIGAGKLICITSHDLHDAMSMFWSNVAPIEMDATCAMMER